MVLMALVTTFMAAPALSIIWPERGARWSALKK